MKNTKRYKPLYATYLQGILFIIIPALLVLSAINYFQTRENILIGFEESKKLTANSISNALLITDRGYRMLEKALDRELVGQFELFLEEYEKSGKNPDAMDLEKLKRQSEMNMDLYIINRDGVIIATTYEKDMGLDFSQYPDFYNSIKRMLDNYKFYSDRLTYEINTLTLRKYAYHPTPDNEYLLELGIQYNEFTDFLGELNPLIIADNLVKLNEDLFTINLFDTSGINSSLNPPQKTDDEQVLDIIKRLTENPRLTITIEDNDKQQETDFVYIKVSKVLDPSNIDRIARLVYSKKRVNRVLFRNALSHITFGLVVIIAAIAAAIFSSMKIANPIHTIVNDVNRIAEGDLNCRIEEQSQNEIRILEESINTMVQTLKNSIERAEESEQKLQQYNEDLENIVEQRSSDLLRAEKLASLGNLVAGVAHEINTPVGIGVTAASHLKKISKDLNGKFSSGTMTKSDFSDYLTGSNESVSIIYTNLNKASELIQSFKKLAVDQTAEDTRDFKMKEIIDNILMSLHPRLKHTNHTVTVNCENIKIKRTSQISRKNASNDQSCY